MQMDNLPPRVRSMSEFQVPWYVPVAEPTIHNREARNHHVRNLNHNKRVS